MGAFLEITSLIAYVLERSSQLLQDILLRQDGVSLDELRTRVRGIAAALNRLVLTADRLTDRVDLSASAENKDAPKDDPLFSMDS